MSERERIVCGAHGETPASFMCRHLASGVACGYHASDEGADDPWPDAWCDLCEEAFQAQGGEWNDESEAVADIQSLCTSCYEAARDRNRQPPALARGARARMAESEVSALLDHVVHEAQRIQAASTRAWGWDALARWDYDADAGTVTFSEGGDAVIVADVQMIGSFSTKTSTFQWAWKTLGAGDPLACAASRLRTFGEVRGIAKLTTPNWAAVEEDGWEMASLAAYLCGADGLYRAPFDHLYWFMLLSNWRRVAS